MEGKGFVGPSGQLLFMLAERAGIKREDVWVTNASLCLDGKARVLLADGSTERIEKLVKEHHPGPVTSMGTDGQLAPRALTGWHRSELARRKLAHVTYASAKGNPRGVVGAYMTADHPVLCEDGKYIPAGALGCATKIATTSRVLTGQSLAIFYGSLLGDGSLSRAEYSETHASAHADYSYCKARALEGLNVTIEPDGDRIRLKSEANRWLYKMRNALHLTKRSKPCWWKSADLFIDRLTMETLAIWYLDDGSLRKGRPGRRPAVDIGCCDFDASEAAKLAKEVRKLGLACTHHGSSSGYSRLYIGTKDAPRVFAAAAPFTPPSMQYKLPLEFRGRFDPRVYDPAPTAPFFDTAVVTKEHRRKDTQRKKPRPVYCLDVAGSHNFIVGGQSGIVVHNCAAKRIELSNAAVIPKTVAKATAAKACRLRLLNELIYVGATVIVPLGNWALWALSDIPKAKIYAYRGSRLDVQLEELASRVAAGTAQAPMRQVQGT
jgi:recombination protein RecA